MGKYKCSNCDDTGFVFLKGNKKPWTTCSNMKCPLFTYKFVVEQYDMTNKVHPVDNMKTVDNVLEFLNRCVPVVANKESDIQLAFDAVLLTGGTFDDKYHDKEAKLHNNKTIEPPKIPTCKHKNVVVSSNFLGTEKFNYCRDCKKEIK